ncbi:hypothetical protein [Sphingomonas immobilis]|uniref:Uncharacterized protein n=1 Tax=Sphingomonas immobilis TaxID=3063997 RepID=A0ABT8ZXH0_9SPHN|nr:hypothetical protein [Sphingomonas sp. CA1-15]MDO7842264.1 hypothetical protein [Sphingomonas sp. CA1-15]
MTDQTSQPPEVDTDEEKRAALARAEREQGVVDQQAASAIPAEKTPAQ